MSKNTITALIYLVSVSLALFIGYYVGSKNPRIVSTANQIVATYMVNSQKKSIELKDVTDKLTTDFADQDRMIYQQKKQAILNIIDEDLRKNNDFTKIDFEQPTPDDVAKMMKSMNLDSRKITDKQRTDIINNLAIGKRNTKIKSLVEEKQKAMAIQILLEPPFAFVNSQNPGPLMVSGNAKNPIQVVFYGNLHCPHCPQAFQKLMELDVEFPNQFKIYFKYMGLEPDQAVAFKTAKSLYCLNDSQKKSGMVAKLMKAYFEKSPDSLESLSKTLSDQQIPPSEMQKCLENKENNGPLRQDAESGHELSKTIGAFFVINNYFVQAAEQKQYIEDLVKFIQNTSK